MSKYQSKLAIALGLLVSISSLNVLAGPPGIPGTGSGVDETTNASALITVSGIVPTVFSLRAIAYADSLDLSEGSKNFHNRFIGVLRFKHNIGINSITVQSDTPNGELRAGKNRDGKDIFYAFGDGKGMTFNVQGDNGQGNCLQIDSALLSGRNLSSTSALHVLSSTAPEVMENDCHLTASWKTAKTIQAAGKYSMIVTITMTAI